MVRWSANRRHAATREGHQHGARTLLPEPRFVPIVPCDISRSPLSRYLQIPKLWSTGRKQLSHTAVGRIIAPASKMSTS